MELGLQTEKLGETALRNVDALAKRFEQKGILSKTYLAALKPFYTSERTRAQLLENLKAAGIAFDPFEPFSEEDRKDFPKGFTQEMMATTVAEELAREYSKTGHISEEMVTKIRPFYADPKSSELMLACFRSAAVKFDCNPFTGEKIEHPKLAVEKTHTRLADVPSMHASAMDPGPEAGHHQKEYEAFKQIVEFAEINPNLVVEVFRVEPKQRSQTVDSQHFEPGENIYLSAEKANVIALGYQSRQEPIDVEVVRKDVPINEIFWRGPRDPYQPGSDFDFKWDPRT